MDDLLFKDDVQPTSTDTAFPPWKILIVDDEEGVHQVTTLALKRFIFDGRSLIFFHAYSAKEAEEILTSNDDIALVLLDIVMETEHAGLDMVKVIREKLKNDSVRIVLRTGQPGQAPEQEVIRAYDINDYKTKTELTANKLSTLMFAALRAYKDITTLKRSKKGLEHLITASRSISTRRALNEFIHMTMDQLTNLLNLDASSVITFESGAFLFEDQFLEAYYPHRIRKIKFEELPEKQKAILNDSIAGKCNVFNSNRLVIHCANQGSTILFYAQISHPLSNFDINLLNIFTANLTVIFENIQLNDRITESQKEMIYRLGEVIESRSNETGNHVKRVALYCERLAQLYGYSKEEVELVKSAAPLHDIGKIAIADEILTTPARLSPDQFEIIKTHCRQGHDVLAGSQLSIIDACAVIALTHHEKWDGSGYPKGLKGEEIHPYGRITAIADVFDALANERCYKKAWPYDKIITLFREERGNHFDPTLADLFLDNVDDFIEINNRHRD